MTTDQHGASIRKLLEPQSNKRLERIADRGGLIGKMARLAASARWSKGRKKKAL